MSKFLKQQWYVAAFADEVVSGAPLARTIIDEPLLLWRGEDGKVSVLADICPHRWAPLSGGRFEGEVVTCGYHGLAFNRDGACVRNPHGPVLESLRVRAYPAVERHGLVWVWTGDSASGNPAEIPDMGWVERSKPTAFSSGYLHTLASHKLFEDNILDLSHADYLHPDSLGGGAVTRSRIAAEERGDTVFVQWRFNKNDVPLPIFRNLLKNPEGGADMWHEVLWHPNGVMILRVGAANPGESPEQGFDTWNAHIMTPETEFTTHYFHINTREYLVDDAGFNALAAAGLRHAFEVEDKPMIEGQQRRLGERDLFDVGPRLLPIDVGSTRARRVFTRLLAAEAEREKAAHA